MKRFFNDIIRIWLCEFRLTFHDLGVLTFFVLLPFLYPVVYSLIYNPEVPREVAVIVVDDDRSPESRNFVREVDASPAVKVVGYAANMQEARQRMAQKECYGILRFDSDFGKLIGNGESGTVEVYADMSLLIRYKNILMSGSFASLQLGSESQNEFVGKLGAQSLSTGAPVEYKLIAIGNTTQGFASAIMPAVLILILQQAFMIGIALLFVTSRERARRNGGIDPEGTTEAGTVATMLGKGLFYFVIIAIPAVFLMRVMPIIFEFPQLGSIWHVMALALPFILCIIAMGMILQSLIPEREAIFPLFVFTSIMFVFLSGVSWPIFAMPRFYQFVAWCLPSTWMINGYVAIMGTGATLAQQAHTYHTLWLLAALYGLMAFAVLTIQKNWTKWRQNRQK